MRSTLKSLFPISVLLASFAAVGCAPSEDNGDDTSQDPSTNDGADNEVKSKASTVCQFEPSSGKENPFGMRAYVTLFKSGSTVTARFEQFPSNAGESGGHRATIESVRELTFYETSLNGARKLLRQKKRLWDELVGKGDPGGFAGWEAAATCAAGAPPKPIVDTAKPSCGFDPNSGKENPLGMRAYFTLSKASDRIDASYEQFPSNIDSGGSPATISSKRVLALYGVTDPAKVRAAFKDKSSGFAQTLFEFGAAESLATYAEIDPTLKCE